MKRALVAALTAITLTGCAGIGGPDPDSPAIAVLDGQLRIKAPRGYCLDPAQRRDGDSGAFLLYGTCQGIRGNGPDPAAAAILTAGVAPGAFAAGQMPALATFLESEAGRDTLARGPNPAGVEILSMEQERDVLFIRARDTDTVDLAEEYWRAVFARSGTLVTLTVSGTAAAPLDPDTGLALIRRFVALTQRANPDG
jgi:hypothetical protein